MVCFPVQEAISLPIHKQAGVALWQVVGQKGLVRQVVWCGVVWSGEGMGEVWTFPAHSSILTVTNIRMLEKC